MDYDAFKSYIVTHLWKMGDSVVIDNLDTLITTANSELNRTFKVEDRTKLETLSAISDMVPLPADYREMRVLSNPHCREMKYYAPAKFFSRKSGWIGGAEHEAYTVINKQIALADAGSFEAPMPLTLMYYANIPDFKVELTSWLADDYLDVYLYCVLKHTAPFLREDERLAVWQSLFAEAVSTAMAENDDRKFAGSPLKIHMPGVK